MIELNFTLLIHQSEVSVIVVENTLEVSYIFPGYVFLHQASLLSLVLKVSFQDNNLPCIFPCKALYNCDLSIR